MTKTMISARVDVKLNEDLEKLAASSRRSKAFVITEALENYVAHEAWINQKINDDFDAAEKSGEWISHEAMEKWIMSLGTVNELPQPEPDVFKAKVVL
jgi:RHH-type transcriptional regulator, rel operon repressor / antitoxin RelB